MLIQLRQLEYVAAIVDEKTMRKAAQKLYISEATISQQIQKLEDELGLSLFNRDKRTLDLSDTGEKLMSDLRTLLQAKQQFEQSVAAMHASASKHIRLSITPDVAMTVFPEIHKNFQKLYPDVMLEVCEDGSHKVREKVSTHQVDLGIFLTSKRVEVPLEKLTVQPLACSEIVALASCHHPLAHKSTISKIQLVKAGIIAYSKDFLLPDLLQAAPGPQSEAKIVFTTDNPEAALRFAQMGMGVAFVPRKMLEERQMVAKWNDLCVLDLAKELKFPIQYVVAYSQQQRQSEAFRALVRMMKESFLTQPSAA
jgi:DNA-binding transcriptional LysR family regulator